MRNNWLWIENWLAHGETSRKLVLQRALSHADQPGRTSERTEMLSVCGVIRGTAPEARGAIPKLLKNAANEKRSNGPEQFAS